MKPQTRPATDTTGDRFAAAIEKHAREYCADARVSAWLLALVSGDRRERSEGAEKDHATGREPVA